MAVTISRCDHHQHIGHDHKMGKRKFDTADSDEEDPKYRELIIQKACSSGRREQHAKKSGIQSTLPLGENFNRSMTTNGISVSAPVKKQRISNADLESINLSVIYRGERVKFLLADLAKSAKPPLPLESAVSQTTMETFIRCCREDLGLIDLQVDVFYTFQGNKCSNKVMSDRQLHGALCDIVDSGNPNQALS